MYVYKPPTSMLPLLYYISLQQQDREIEIEVLQIGDEENYPKLGQSVQFHYVAYYNGNIWSSTKVNNNPRSIYQLGKNETGVAGIDLALQQMSLGEVARVKIPWELAYGEHGMPPLVPAKADVVFEIELMKYW